MAKSLVLTDRRGFEAVAALHRDTVVPSYDPLHRIVLVTVYDDQRQEILAQAMHFLPHAETQPIGTTCMVRE